MSSNGLFPTNESPDRVAVHEGIAVGAGGDRELKADVFMPPAVRANGAGVLLIHGGGWISGDRAQLRGYGILLGRAGYTCVACEYRLAPGAKWPAQIDDVRTAYRWMRDHAGELGVDRERIAVEGNSAGAHLSLMMAALEPTVAACISIYPPADLTLRHAQGLTEEQRRVNPVRQLLPEITEEALREASPTAYARPGFPPTMLIHGNADEIVAVHNSFTMYDALIAAGAKCELHVFDGQPHAFDREPALGRQCASLMTLFLSRHVLAPVPEAVRS
jgi:acetyl esterase/lipase